MRSSLKVVFMHLISVVGRYLYSFFKCVLSFRFIVYEFIDCKIDFRITVMVIDEELFSHVNFMLEVGPSLGNIICTLVVTKDKANLIRIINIIVLIKFMP